MAAAKPLLQSLPEWAAEIPYQVKKMAVSDAFQAFSNGCKRAKKTGKPFKLSFRSRKDPQQSCFIPKSALSEKGVYNSKVSKLTGDESLRMSEQVPEGACDSRLTMRAGRWYLNVPYKSKTVKADNQGRAVAIDPGVRTFATLFSEDSATKVGEQAISRIYRLSKFLDRTYSDKSSAKSKEKRRLQKRIDRTKHKIWDLVDELHFKLIRHLLDNFDLIYLPDFKTSEMTNRSKRKIGSKTARQMLTLSHFKFKQRLKSSATSLGKTVLDVCEAYTSKTASWTGEMRQIGSAKYIKSSGVTLDRDVNGARGIYLRALVDTPRLSRQLAMFQQASAC